MPVTLEENDSSCILHLQGEMAISTALELKEDLLHALASQKSLYLKLAEVSEIDVTIMQLLWAATSEASRAGSPISVEGPVSEQIKAALNIAGLASSLEIQP